VLNSDEARSALAAGRPWSFLHISKPEIDLPADTDPYDAGGLRPRRRKISSHMIDSRRPRNSDDDALLLRVPACIMGAHVQTGLVCAASVADYDSQPHPQATNSPAPTRKTTACARSTALECADRAGAAGLPGRSPEVDALIALATNQGDAGRRRHADDGVRHTLWVIADVPTASPG
jgi:uncharacterized protein (DUF1015 family)